MDQIWEVWTWGKAKEAEVESPETINKKE
jgi:hypothetical protein